MTGQTLSHFKIIAKLGEGGMGEVYRATDSHLKRDIALKILPAEMAARPERLERFQREAEAVAALNHPNIVTIHSVEHDQGVHFLTMELVDGESLDHTLRRGVMPLARALEITAAVADALSAAHERGIVHRDLKPGNVMLASGGHVKVLDFGLAKLSHEPSPESVEGATEMPTEVRPLTEEGVVMGTAPYMAPEQAQGQLVDFRSDIFSLGCILYETATGDRAFSGESTIDTLHKVIHDEPEPLSEQLPTAPMQLQWILRKALAKDPDRRYQSASDMAVDLRETRTDLDSDAQMATVTSAGTRVSAQASSRSPWKSAITKGGLLVGALIVTYFGWQALDTEPQKAQPAMSIRPITSSGVVTAAAISPDGKYVGYVEAYQGEQSLHLRQLGSAQSLELIPRGPVGYWSLTFTPESDEIVFGLKDNKDYLGAMYRISALGGTPRKLVDHVDSPPTFSPDGSRFAWLRGGYPEGSQSALMVADADGSDERVLVAKSPPAVLAPRYYVAPSWSPDGSLIAASVASSETAKGWIEAYRRRDRRAGLDIRAPLGSGVSGRLATGGRRPVGHRDTRSGTQPTDLAGSIPAGGTTSGYRRSLLVSDRKSRVRRPNDGGCPEHLRIDDVEQARRRLRYSGSHIVDPDGRQIRIRLPGRWPTRLPDR